jgi:hypothetical protein
MMLTRRGYHDHDPRRGSTLEFTPTEFLAKADSCGFVSQMKARCRTTGGR